MTGMSYGNGLAHSRNFDQDYRLTALSTGAVQSLAYTEDAANDITAMTNTLDATRNQSFSYDALNRLTGATGIYGTEGYTYDANGNRLSSILNSFPETYTYDTQSQHLLQTVNGGTRNYSYDGNGNTTDNGNRQFTYGDNNRLKDAQIAGSPVATYTYNGQGERVKKVGTDTTLYFYDQNGQVLAETDAQGNTTQEYLTVEGMSLGMVSGGTVVTYIHTDHLGTPQLITDASQAVVWAADYTPFGSVNLTTETVTNNLRFPGQYFDAETNLFYNHNRYYDPTLGRYITSDPIGLGAGTNTYAYAGANPAMYVDPSGLKMNWMDPHEATVNAMPKINIPYNGATPKDISKAEVRAITNVYWNATCTCSCKGDAYTLDDCNVDVQVQILILRDLPPNCHHWWFREQENDHVKDIQEWVEHAAQEIERTVEESYKNVPFDDKETCESGIAATLEGSLSAAFGASGGPFETSRKKYDTNYFLKPPGKHNLPCQ
jgi:RHS repeat-associated protein